jgi:formamidopyrimidine-DNA glycosylase
MPELPDVARFQQYLNATALHKTIGQVHIHDDDLLGDISSRQFRSQLRQRSFESTRRHGK